MTVSGLTDVNQPSMLSMTALDSRCFPCAYRLSSRCSCGLMPTQKAYVRPGVTRRGARNVTAAEFEGIGRAGGPLLRSSLVVLGKGGCYDTNGRQRCDTSAGEF